MAILNSLVKFLAFQTDDSDIVNFMNFFEKSSFGSQREKESISFSILG